MKINSPAISFKGYDAAPLKRLYMDTSVPYGVKSQMEAVGKEEGIEIVMQKDYKRWQQDDKVIIEKAGKPFMVANDSVDESFIYALKTNYGIESKKGFRDIDGGNVFIGRYPDGRKWLMTGKERNERSLEDISKAYDVDINNIIEIPQQNFHLDMFIRPVGYPIVLVNDPKLVKQNIKKIAEKMGYTEEIKRHIIELLLKENSGYASCEDTVKALYRNGFIPVRVAGDYGSGVNFMNAIANERDDGSISYITNSSKCKSKFYSKLEEMFLEEIQEKVPDIEKVYFIAGSQYENGTNDMMGTIKYLDGGIHCLCLEEVNFKKQAV